MDKFHVHQDQHGVWQNCYHYCRNLLANWQFWAGMTLSFPVEHLLWDKVPPFMYLTKWLGL